jgi:hypothetical protein
MLRDTCFEFNDKIGDFVREEISALKADLDKYSQPPFDYEHGEILAIRRAIAIFESDPCNANMIALLQILEEVRAFHDTAPSVDVDIPAFKAVMAEALQS